MRVSKEALLIILAFIAPIIVELRTVLAWANIELTVLESVVLGLAIVALVLVWAFFPEDESSSETPERQLSNGD
ncbi:CbaC protein [Natronolimnohabitans sp. A-GB9]|uniref:CbaC protein n=1 Tax=Natronolimnohabitans sp. A-GB9 TaxID=3069757 RepID=UPI0027AE9C3B|nr:CbaC protein [Natronolimnohabitans sp. A-GB9]MDQ2050768.1 CbaC protein [Natronolimnohabitans sp. A-GB9]